MATSADVFFSQSAAYTSVTCDNSPTLGLKSLNNSEPNADRLSNLIEKLQKKQLALEVLADVSKSKNKAILSEGRKRILQDLPKNCYALLGSWAVLDELKRCAIQAGATFSVVSGGSETDGFDVVKIAVVDLVSVEVKVKQSGSVNAVSVVSSLLPSDMMARAKQVFSSLLTSNKFKEFSRLFKGWLSIYHDCTFDNVKVRPKVVSAVSAILSDIDAINRHFSNSLDAPMRSMIKSVVHGSPCGQCLQFPQVDKPTLRFFVSPYDVMRAGKSMDLDISELDERFGFDAVIDFQSVNSSSALPDLTNYTGLPVGQQPTSKSSVRKIQTAPMITSIQPLKITPSLNVNNSSPMPIAFALTFKKPLPLFACFVRELNEYTKSILVESKDTYQWLYALCGDQGVVPDSTHLYTHSLPSCDLRVRLNCSKSCSEVTSVGSTYMVQSVLFTHVNPLPHIVAILRKQAAVNTLIGDLMKKQEIGNSAKEVEVFMPSVDKISLKMTHPTKSGCIVTVDTMVLEPDFANPSCKISTSDGSFICEDSYPTTILRKGGSLAHLARSVLRKCSTLNIDVLTPGSAAKVPPPLTPTIDVKSVICFDKNSIDSADIDIPYKQSSSLSSNVQPLKLSDMLQTDAMSPKNSQFEDFMTTLNGNSQHSHSASQSPAPNRKRSRVKSTQDEPSDSSKSGKGSGGKGATKMKKQALPLNVTPQTALQFQHIQMLSMMANPLFMTSSLLPPTGVTQDLPQSVDSSQQSPITSSSAPQDSKLREILNSPKGNHPSTPTTPSSLGGSMQFAVPNLDQLTAQRNSSTPPTMSPVHAEFMLSQQAALAQFTSAYARSLKAGLYPSPTLSMVDQSQHHSAFNYPPTSHLQSFLQPSMSLPSGLSMDSKSMVASPSITPASTPDLTNVNSNSLPVDPFAASDVASMKANNVSMSSQGTDERDREHAMRHLADLIKQLENNKNNLSHSEIEAIEHQMNQISNKLKDVRSGVVMTGANKRKNSYDYTDSSSVSSNQSLNDSKNMNDSVFSVAPPPKKSSKNSGPPKRRGRPPKAEMKDGQSPVAQLTSKTPRFENPGIEAGSMLTVSPVKMLKLPTTTSGSKPRTEFDAFEMSDDSSDSNMTPLSINMTPSAPSVKKPKVPKKRNPKKSNADVGATVVDASSNNAALTTYKSLNKSDTVIVIKKLQVPPATQAASSSNKDESTSTAVGSPAQVPTPTSKEDKTSLEQNSNIGSTLATTSKLPISSKETAASSCSTGKSGHDFMKHSLSLDNKPSPMKNLLASFAAESAGVATVQKTVSTYSSTATTEAASPSQSSGDNSQTGSTNTAGSGSPGSALISGSPTKKRLGLESVVNKLSSQSPSSSSSGVSTLAQTGSSKTPIVASTLLKSNALKSHSGSKDSSRPGKIKLSSGDKSKFAADKGSQKASHHTKPGSPIASVLPSFLKSTNKLSNFVIPKKKSGGSGNGTSSSECNASGDSVSASKLGTSSSPASVEAKTKSDKMFDFPANDDPVSVLAPPTAPKNLSRSISPVASSATNVTSSASTFSNKTSLTIPITRCVTPSLMKTTSSRSPMDQSSQEGKALNLSMSLDSESTKRD